MMREGADLTIITWGYTVHLPMQVARQLEPLADLPSITSLDEDLIAGSVRKTNRVLVAHKDSLTMGFGAEFAALIGHNRTELL